MAKKRKLTNKQKAFVREYQKDFNATRAVKEAGYQTNYPAEMGYQLLHKTPVKDEVAQVIEKQAEVANIGVQKILEELMFIAFGDISQCMSWTDAGVAFIDSTKLTGNITRAISEVNETITAHGGSRRIKMHDKLKALELLGKYVGMFKEQLEVTQKPFHAQIVEMIEAKKRADGK